MADCPKIKRKASKVCIGSMNKLIELQERTLTAPDFASSTDVDYEENFVTVASVWAMVDTVAGETLFDNTNIERVVTHRFYIRFRSDVSFEKWILYNSERFKILSVENLNEGSSFLLIRATNRGASSNESTKA